MVPLPRACAVGEKRLDGNATLDRTYNTRRFVLEYKILADLFTCAELYLERQHEVLAPLEAVIEESTRAVIQSCDMFICAETPSCVASRSRRRSREVSSVVLLRKRSFLLAHVAV